MAEIIKFPTSRAKARLTTLKVPVKIEERDPLTGKWRVVEERVETVVIEPPGRRG